MKKFMLMKIFPIGLVSMTKRIQESKLDINYNGIFCKVITEFTFLKILSEYHVKTSQYKNQCYLF